MFNFKDINQLKDFLKKFNISEEIINNFLDNKILKNIDNNIFLLNENYINLIRNKKELKYKDFLVSIHLKDYLPSKFLLEFIFQNSKNLIIIKNEKRALDFSYNKDINFQNVSFKNFKNKYENLYIVIYNNNILGIGKIKKNYIKNIFNIGKYLKEN